MNETAAFAALLARPAVADLLAALSPDGAPETTRIVGGAVRDILTGGEPGDVDFATTLEPAETIARAQAAGLKVSPTGLAHGTVTVIARHVGHQVTTLRRDVATDGRRALVAFGTDWAEDAARRDFTANALYLGRDGTLRDPLGAREDVLARRVRFIGDPDKRIAEDALRILRFFRFAADFGQGRFDAAGLAACARGKERLKELSRERVRQELTKLLVAPHAIAAVETMADLGLLKLLLPGSDVHLFARMVAAEAAVDAEPEAMLRLWALACGPRGDTGALAARLALSKKEAAVLAVVAAEAAGLAAKPDTDAARVVLHRVGPEHFPHVVTAAAALSPHLRWRWLRELPRTHPVPRFPVTARDIIKQGVPPGPKVGKALRLLEDLWVRAGFPETFAEDLAQIDWRVLDDGG